MTLLRFPLIVLLATACVCSASDSKPSLSPDDALKRLVEGNQRFVSGAPTHTNQSAARRAELGAGQAPFAIVLTCADSRVTPEIVFDQGLGDIFVLRNAGNVVDDHTIGSIEYAVEHLGAKLIVVMGHEKCGAVAATVAGGHAPGHIHSIVDAIQPALERVKDLTGDKVENVVRASAQRTAEILSRVEPIVGESVKAGKTKVVAARYELNSGRVEILK